METHTKTELENEMKRISVDYLREVVAYGHDSTKATKFYDDIYHLGQLSQRINDAAKQSKEAKPAED